MTVALSLSGAAPAHSGLQTAAKAGTRAMWLWGNYPADEVVPWAAKRGVSEK